MLQFPYRVHAAQDVSLLILGDEVGNVVKPRDAEPLTDLIMREVELLSLRQLAWRRHPGSVVGNPSGSWVHRRGAPVPRFSLLHLQTASLALLVEKRLEVDGWHRVGRRNGLCPWLLSKRAREIWLARHEIST